MIIYNVLQFFPFFISLYCFEKKIKACTVRIAFEVCHVHHMRFSPSRSVIRKKEIICAQLYLYTGEVYREGILRELMRRYFHFRSEKRVHERMHIYLYHI